MKEFPFAKGFLCPTLNFKFPNAAIVSEEECVNMVYNPKVKGQEYPDFCHPGTFVSFPDYTATSSGTSGNGPVGPENSV